MKSALALVAGLVAVVVLCLPRPGALAGDEPAPGAPASVVRLYDVGALTHLRRDYVREREPIVVPDMVSDSQWPLFGKTSDEPTLPLGNVDEVTHLLETWLDLRPARSEDVDLWEEGAHAFWLRAPPDLHERVRAWLAERQAAVGRTVTVEIRLVRVDGERAARLLQGDDAAAVDAAAKQALAAAGGGAGVSVTCHDGQQAAVFGGKQVTWLEDADVEIAQASSTTDPFVGVSNVGLMAHVRPVVGPDGRVTVSLEAAVAKMGPPRLVSTARTGVLEAPVHEVAVARPTLRVEAGKWALADACLAGDEGGWWAFLVRATPHAYEPGPGRGGEVDLGPPLAPAEGDFETRAYDVRDFAAPIASRAGETICLVPSGYVPPEPLALADPYPQFAPELLQHLLLRSAEEDAWADPASIELRNGNLLVRQRAAAHEGIERVLRSLRETWLWTLGVEAGVALVPADLAGDLAAAGALDEGLAGRLSQALASGGAKPLAALRLTSAAGRRNTVLAGERVPYLQDYEPVIAEGAAIGKPIIQDVLSGAQLVVEAARTVDGGAVELEVEFVRSDLKRPIRTVATEHGDVELPEMDLIRVRTGMVVPLSRLAVAASWTAEGRHLVLLLRPWIR